MTITSRPSGLTSDEVRRRLLEHGPNLAVPRRVRPKVWHWLTRALSDPMTLLLLVAAPTYLALGDAVSAAIAVGVGAGVAVGVIGAYVLRRDAGASAVDARAFAFAVLLVAEILVVFVVRAGDEPFWRVGTRGNRSLLGVTAVSIAMAAMVFLVTPLRELLRLGTLDAAQAAAAIGVAIVAVVVPSVAWRVRSGGW